ncbi:MAG: methyltransferase [Alphaproteobacteria bacterium]
MAKERLTTVRLQNLSQAYLNSAVLWAAVEIGLFTQISNGVTGFGELAEAVGTTETNAERMVTACLALDLLEKTDGTIRNTPDVERFLVEGQEGFAGPWITFTKPEWNEWGRLSEHLRDTRPPNVLGMYEDISYDQAKRYHKATYSIGLGAGRLFSRKVDLGQRKRVLDLGGGSGAYCIAACQKYPQITAIVLDRPAVTEVAAELIAEHGLADRIETLPGDMAADPFPEGVDVIIMASNLSLFSADAFRGIVAKALAALEPGGEMHLIGHMLNDERTGPVVPAIWAVAQAIYNSSGGLHSISDCIGYLAEAGFSNVAYDEHLPGMLDRVTGTKPA